jgi:hypothetical protein
MNEMHLSDEQLSQLFFGEESGESPQGDAHLRSCADCRERYAEIIELSAMLERLSVPPLSANDKIALFDSAWRSSGLARKKQRWEFVRPLLRHALSFGVGLACGMALLAVIASQTEAQSPMSINNQVSIPAQPKNPVPPMLSGTPAAKVYSELENPVIIEQKEEQNTKQQSKQRVLEGTLENGSVQIVWNL